MAGNAIRMPQITRLSNSSYCCKQELTLPRQGFYRTRAPVNPQVTNRAMVSHYLSDEIWLRIVAALCHLDSHERKQSENRERKLVGFIIRWRKDLYLF